MAVELLGARYTLRSGGEAEPVFDACAFPLWRVEGIGAQPVSVELEATSGSTLALDATVERHEGFGIVRTASTSTTGDFIARLRLGEQVVWSGRLRVLARPSELPEIVKALEGSQEDLPPALSRVRALRAAEDIALRNAAYIIEGRYLYDAGRAAEAGDVWRAGAADPVLLTEVPAAAAYLQSSATFVGVHTGRLDAAERDLEVLRRMATRVGPPFRVAAPEFYAGRIAVHREMPLAASRALRRSQEAAKRAGDRAFTAVVLQMLGNLELRLGRYTTAMALHREALVHAAVRPGIALMAEEDLLWDELIGVKSGVFETPLSEIEAKYQRILPRFEASGRPSNIARVRATLADLALGRGDVAKAAAWVAPMPAVDFEDFGFERWFIRLTLARVLLAEGKLEAAARAADSIRAALGAETHAVGHGAVGLARLDADLAAARGDPDAAQKLEAAWRVAQRSARDLGTVGAGNHALHMQRDLPIRVARAKADPVEAARVVEDALRARWSQLLVLDAVESRPELWAPVEAAREARRAAEDAPCERKPPGAKEDCLQARATARQEAREAEMALMGALAVELEAPARAELEALREGLEAGEGVLLGLAAEEDRIVVLAHPGGWQVAGSLQALSPWLSRLSRVAVAGDVDLVAAPDPEGRPWGARLAVRRWPSALWRRPPVERSTGVEVAFVDPKGDLPHTRQGSVALVKRFGVTPRLGEAVRREAVLEALHARPALFLFSGHADAFELDRSSTSLQLDDGILDMQDVLTKGLSAELVVLNACSSGGPAKGYGVGLGDALLLEGSGAVLATIEPVEDVESTRFLERFFAAGPGVAPAEAFRDAVRASVEAGDDVWRRYRLWAR